MSGRCPSLPNLTVWEQDFYGTKRFLVVTKMLKMSVYLSKRGKGLDGFI